MVSKPVVCLDDEKDEMRLRSVDNYGHSKAGK